MKYILLSILFPLSTLSQLSTYLRAALGSWLSLGRAWSWKRSSGQRADPKEISPLCAPSGSLALCFRTCLYSIFPCPERTLLCLRSDAVKTQVNSDATGNTRGLPCQSVRSRPPTPPFRWDVTYFRTPEFISSEPRPVTSGSRSADLLLLLPPFHHQLLLSYRRDPTPLLSNASRQSLRESFHSSSLPLVRSRLRSPSAQLSVSSALAFFCRASASSRRREQQERGGEESAST